MKVKKRDGQIVEFDISKIIEAISGANQDVKGREKANIANKKEIAKSIQEMDKDIILASLILHDTYKHGTIESKYTIVEHSLVAAQAVRNSKGIIKQEWRELIANNISTHMGRWTKNYKSGQDVLTPPKSGMQKFVHQCDYMASRKCLLFDFDAELSK